MLIHPDDPDLISGCRKELHERFSGLLDGEQIDFGDWAATPRLMAPSVSWTGFQAFAGIALISGLIIGVGSLWWEESTRADSLYAPLFFLGVSLYWPAYDIILGLHSSRSTKILKWVYITLVILGALITLPLNPATLVVASFSMGVGVGNAEGVGQECERKNQILRNLYPSRRRSVVELADNPYDQAAALVDPRGGNPPR